MPQSTIVLLGVTTYLLLMLAVGIYAAGRTHSPTDFMVAGRSLGLGMSTTSLMATWIGGGTILGAAGAAHQDGFLGVIADPFGAALGLMVVGLFFVRLIRRLRLITIVQFFEQRYGRLAAMIAALGYTLSSTAWAGALMVAFGVTLETLTGFPLEYGILVGAVIVLIYTAAGGLWAVALTDFVQILIIVIGLVILFAVVIWKLGGVGVVWAGIPEGSFRMIPRVELGETGAGGVWLDYLRAWLIIGIADSGSQNLMQRGLASRNEATAQYAFYLAGIGYLVIGLIPVTLGIIAAVYLPGLEDPESVIPTLAMEHLHPVLLAVFVGALLAAIMSSADSALLAASSLITTNILPYLGVRMSPAGHLLALRVTIPVIGIAAVIVALKVQVVYELVLDANTVMLAAVAAPYVLGIWWWRANRAGALAGMFAGLATWLGLRAIMPELPTDLLGGAMCLLTMLVVIPLSQRASPPRPLTDIDGNEVAFGDRLGVLPPRRVVSSADASMPGE